MTRAPDRAPLVSVVIPAFNAMAFIGRCLESLSRQTLQPIEIIVVDDGSSDGTAALVRRHDAPNLRLLQKANGGTSSAKNLGLAQATGDYVLFLDSDDWLEGSCLERLHAAALAEDLDIVASDVYLDFPGQPPRYVRASPPAAEWQTREQILADLLTMRNISWMASRLCRRALFEDHQLRFDEGIHLSEDRVLDLKLFFHARRVGKLDEAFLHYVQREGSLSRKRDRDYFGDIAAHYQIVRFLEAAGLADRYRQELSYLEYRTVFISLVCSRQLSDRHFEEYARIRPNIALYGDNPLVRSYARQSLGMRTRLHALAYRISYRLGRAARSLSEALHELRHRHITGGTLPATEMDESLRS